MIKMNATSGGEPGAEAWFRCEPHGLTVDLYKDPGPYADPCDQWLTRLSATASAELRTVLFRALDDDQAYGFVDTPSGVLHVERVQGAVRLKAATGSTPIALDVSAADARRLAEAIRV